MTKKIDIVVGIPSYNEADSISHVVKVVDKGLTKYFPNFKCRIVNVDNYSKDGTKDVFLKTRTKTEKIYASTPIGVKGKGNNILNLFKISSELNAKVTIMVDADLKSIKPGWIKLMVDPIIGGYDLVTPHYSRHKYDGTITNSIVFPIIYGIIGKNIRQPIGGEYALSNRFVKHLLREKWNKSTKRYGVDVFITTNAIFGKFKICSAGLGVKIHKPSAPKLGWMFIQVVDTLFGMIIKNKEKLNTNSVENFEFFGLNKFLEPQTVIINEKDVTNQSITHYYENREELSKILPKEMFEKIDDMFKNRKWDMKFRLWTNIIFEFIIKYGENKNKLKLIKLFESLYFARIVSFIDHTINLNHEESEEKILMQAQCFNKYKNDFIKRLSYK